MKLRETIREVIREERLALSIILTAYASDKESQEIQTKFGSPSQYDKRGFINMTNWVNHET